MEFPFDVNAVISGKVCVLDKDLRQTEVLINDDSKVSADKVIKSSSDSLIQQQLCEIINAMGEASAKAQNLQVPITTDEKLKASDHHLYIMKEEEANSNHGAVVGILKVGPKHLFVLNREGEIYECSPLCILDFYIHKLRQRKGFGYILFEHMLKEEKIETGHMAADRPSNRFLAFLKKYYYLHNPIQQTNNFVLFDEFFINNPVFQKSAKRSNLTKQEEDQIAELAIKETCNGNSTQLNDFTQTQSPFIKKISDQFVSRGLPSSQNDEICSLSRQQTSATKLSNLDDVLRTEFHTPIKLFKNSTPQDQESSNPIYTSSSWKVLGVPPRNYNHAEFVSVPTNKNDKVQRRLW